MSKGNHGFFRDEQGNPSMARVLLASSLTLTFVLIYADTVSAAMDVPPEAYALLGTVFAGLLAWAAGPRIARHLSNLGGVAAGIASAAGRRAGTDDRFKDDERG